MNSDDDIKFDEELTRHFADRLDPQRGRAVRAFDEHIRARSTQRTWLLAASIALIFIGGTIATIASLWSTSPRHSPVAPRVFADSHHPAATSPASAPATLDTPQDVTQLVAWAASDEGIESVKVQDQLMPARKVRREAVETTEWFDPQLKAQMTLTVPVEQVIWIQEDTY